MDVRDYLREFICAEISVLKHSNQSIIGLSGHIVDETARTFRVETDGGLKIIPKDTGRFTIRSAGFNITVKGSSIMMRPEERLKNLRRIMKNENRGDDNN